MVAAPHVATVEEAVRGAMVVEALAGALTPVEVEAMRAVVAAAVIAAEAVRTAAEAAVIRIANALR